MVGTPALAQDVEPDVAESSQESELFASPREAFGAFLEAVAEHRFVDVAATFEPFDGDPIVVANELYDTLNRTEYIDLGAVPNRSELAPGQPFWVYEGHPPSEPSVQVQIYFVLGDDGGWRISARTLNEVPAMAAAVAHLPYVDEFVSDLSVLEWLHYRLQAGLPDALTERGFVLENWKWLGLLLLAFLAVATDRLVRFVVARFAARIARREKLHLDAELLFSFQRPVGLLFAVLAFELLLPVLGLDEGVRDMLLLATSFVGAVAGVWAAYRLVDVLCGFLLERASGTDNKFDDMLVPLVGRTLKIFVLVVGIVFIASRLTEDLWGVVAGLGLGSIAVGFAAQDSIENLFGTFTVLMDKPFQVGDWIIVGDLQGTVEQVGFRSTRIRTFYNSVIQVPNRTFISSSVDNMGERRYRRVKSTLALTYDTPPEKIEAFCEGVREIIRSHPYTRKDYYHVYLTEFGAASLDVMLYCFVETPEWATELREKHRLFADILRLAEKLGVSFAFPTQTIHVAKPEDMEHPDRPQSDPDGAEWGRRAAHEVVEKTLAPFGGVGEQPPPVRIQTKPRYGSDGEGGKA